MPCRRNAAGTGYRLGLPIGRRATGGPPACRDSGGSVNTRHPSRNDMDTGVGATTVFPASDLPGATHGDGDAVRTASATREERGTARLQATAPPVRARAAGAASSVPPCILSETASASMYRNDTRMHVHTHTHMHAHRRSPKLPAKERVYLRSLHTPRGAAQRASSHAVSIFLAIVPRIKMHILLYHSLFQITATLISPTQEIQFFNLMSLHQEQTLSR